MPKRISKRNQENIYCAYRIGAFKEKTEYTAEVYELQCQFLKFNGFKSVELYGTNINYEAIAMFENNTANKHIDEFAKIWHSYKPKNGNNNAEYKIQGITLTNDGLKMAYLSYVKQNAKDIWFLGKNNRIYSIEVDYDKETDTIYIPINMYCTIDYNTKVWVNEPISENDTVGLKEVTFIEIVDNRKVIQLGDSSIEKQ